MEIDIDDDGKMTVLGFPKDNLVDRCAPPRL